MYIVKSIYGLCFPQEEIISTIDSNAFQRQSQASRALINMSSEDSKQVRRNSNLAESGSDSFLRSDPLVLCEIVLPAEVAFECLVALGNSIDPVHIGSGDLLASAISANSISGPVKLCRDLQLTLDSIKTHLAVHKDYIQLHCDKNNIRGTEVEDTEGLAMGLKPKSLFDLEANIVSLHKDLLELSGYETEMNNRYIHLIHLVNILDCLDNIFWARRVDKLLTENDSRVLLDGSSESVSDSGEVESTLPFTVGVVPTTKAQGLQLGIWRRFRLTALYTDTMVRDQMDLREQPVTSHNIFLIVTLTQEQKLVAQRLCGMLGAQVFSVPQTKNLRSQLSDDTKEKLSEMRQVFLEGDDHRKRLTLNGWGKWKRWRTQLCLIQSVYQALTQFRLGITKLYYVGDVWCSRDSIDSVQAALNEGSSKASGVRASIRLVESHRHNPPTRMPRHEVTSAVRDLIYQFGIPRYREIDPTPFTAITFPFLFAIMFGDWGHGLVLLVFALILFLPEGNCLMHPDVSAVIRPLRPMKFLLLLSAIFAIYCGVVLNEGFGLTVGWRRRSQFSMGNLTYEALVNRSISMMQLAPREAGHGMSWATDSMWGGAANEVKFFNSARMKMSIIFGFLHLMLGLSLQLANDIYSGRLANLFLFSLAKLLFHSLLMGYPVALIVLKWLTVKPADAACAPALLPMLISMYRFAYTDTPCYLATFYPGQKYVEHGIVCGVVACAILAVIGLPVYDALSNSSDQPQLQETRRLPSMLVPDGFDGLEGTKARQSVFRAPPLITAEQPAEKEPGDGHFDLLEHCLHCFEFLLSSLSHSASYLRLWAIGLAHGELTSIMWPLLLMPPTKLSDMLARSPATSHLISGVTLSLSFCVWACVTMLILVGMEGMTALLHSLRLHWIEFQSKFYSGDGYLFHPFSLKSVAARTAEACKNFSQAEEFQ